MLTYTNYPIVMKLLGVSHLASFLKGDVHHVLKPCVAQFKRKLVNPLIVLRKKSSAGEEIPLTFIEKNVLLSFISSL